MDAATRTSNGRAGLRVALYARTSTADGRQDPETQLRALRAYAAAQEWTVAGEYVDQESGARSSTERAELARLIADAAAGRFQRVLVFSLSRLTREGIGATFSYITRLKSSGVDFWSCTEEMFRTAGPAGELFIAIAAYIAEQERLAHIARVRAGMDRAAAAGRHPGRPRRPIDRYQIQLLHEEGFSVREIAARLALARTTVHRALTNPHPKKVTPA